MKNAKQKTLGPVSAGFIGELYKRNKIIFTLNEAEKIYAKTRLQTIKFIGDLVKRNILAQIKSGVYIILQAGQESLQLSQWPVIARELAGRKKYFLSHYSAMRLHGMTTHPLLNTYVTVLKKQTIKSIQSINYHFICSKPEHFWGWEKFWVSKQEKVYVSDLERTVLDCLDRPELCGGVKEIAIGIWTKHQEINKIKLIKYAKRYRTKASVKRLGFILEIFGFDSEFVINLNKIIFSTNDYILLDPTGSKMGKYISRWRIRINYNIEELKRSIWG